MSDFDKQSASGGKPGKSNSKVGVLVALVAVLAGVGIFHFMKGGPQEASGAALATGDASAGAVEAPSETAVQAMAALQDDPTAKLLRNINEADQAQSTTPTNPFVLNEKWRSSLVKAPDPVAVADATEPLRADPVKPAAPAPQTVDGTGFKVAGIFKEGQRMAAIVNGNIVYVGSVVGNARVVAIAANKVTLQHSNAANGPTVDLTLTSK